MKKLLTLALCLVLAMAMFTSTACGGDTTFKGNYSKASTMEELSQSVNEAGAIDLLAPLGLTVSADVKLGTKPVGEGFIDSTSNYDIGLDLKLAAKPATETEAFSLLAQGNLDFDLESIYEDGTTEMEFSSKLYMDSEALYLNAKYNFDGEKDEQKGKIAIEDIIDFILNITSGGIGPMSEEEPSIGLDPELVELIATKAKFYVDEVDNGKKFKITVAEEDVGAFLDKIASTPDDLYSGNIKADAFEVYIVLDGEGMLKAFKIDLDIEYDMLVEEDETPRAIAEVVVDIELSVKIGDVKISLPSDLSEYEDLMAGEEL